MARIPVFLLLAILGLLAYANAIFHPFVHDDIVFLLRNPNIGALDPGNFFHMSSAPNIDLPYVNQYYRPLLELINRALYRIIGFNPYGFHFFNIAVHIINSYLVFMVSRSITNGRRGAALALAVLFLLHPVQTEAVACVSGVSNLVFAFFCLISFYWYLKSTRSNGHWGHYAAALVLFAFSLMAKEQSVILPVIICTYELCFGKRLFRIARDKWLPVAGFLTVLAGYFVLRKIFLGASLPTGEFSYREYLLILLAIPRSLLTYAGLIFFPHGLHYYRSQDFLLPYAGPVAILSVIILATIFLISRLPDPYKRWSLFGLAWFLISLAPTLNIVPMINEYSLILTAEHFLYFPIIGMLLFVIAVWTFWADQKHIRNRRTASYWVAGIIAAIFLGLTVRQNTFWRSEIALFERTLAYQPGFGRARLLLSHSYAKNGQFDRAVAEDQKALAIMQSYLDRIKVKEVEDFYLEFILKAHYHLAQCFNQMGDSRQSLVHYKKAFALEPKNLFLEFTVALAYIKIKDYQNAILHLEHIIEVDERNVTATNTLAVCYKEIGEMEKAEKYLRKVVELDSGSESAKRNLEEFLRRKGASR